MMRESNEIKAYWLIYLCAFAVSLFISDWQNFRELLVNPDGICYLLSAKKVGALPLSDVMHYCPQAIWPFYSVLIHYLASFSHLSYLTTAQFINAIFTGTMVVAFIGCVHILDKHEVQRIPFDGPKKIMIFAAITILFAHDVNHVRTNIVRDHGYWACYVVSLFWFLKFFHKPYLRHALAWQISLYIAVLFRIEAVVFLVLTPWVVWLRCHTSWCARANQFLQLNAGNGILFILIGCWIFFHPQSQHYLSRLYEIYQQLLHGWAQVNARYDAVTVGLRDHVLSAASARDAGNLTILLFISGFLLNILESLSWVYALLIVYALNTKRFFLSGRARLALCSYIFINLLICGVFYAENLFLARRYLMAASLIFMIWVPFALNDIARQIKLQQLKRWVGWLVGLMLVYAALGGLFDFGYSKRYMLEASDWLSKNVPSQASLYMNDLQLMYYANHSGDAIFKQFDQEHDLAVLSNNQWRRYDYLALRITRANQAQALPIMTILQPYRLREWHNARGDQVVVYRIYRESKSINNSRR